MGCQVKFCREILIWWKEHKMSNEKKLLEATIFMDSTERRTLNRAARGAAGKSYEQILTEI
jgi:hypothetical protein